jgi:gliding motility-associated-like protein
MLQRKLRLFLKILPAWWIAGFLLAPAANAQLCTGSLGDPVVNITFGTPTRPSGYSATNAYQYWSTPCPNDGYYTLTTSTSNCWNGSWHTVSRDHTGDNGYFFLVNATFLPGDFFVTTVKGLCPNTTYEFASWMVNVMRQAGILPNIRFRIETPGGTVLKEYTTGDIPRTNEAEWKQYGFFFTTTSGLNEVVLRLTNNAPGGIGNDIGLDDITFRACGPQIDVSIPGIINPYIACVEDDTAQMFTASVTAGFNNPVYQWQQSLDNGRSWQNISGEQSLSYLRTPKGLGNFQYRIVVVEKGNEANTGCWIGSDAFAANIVGPPVVNAGPDRSLVKGDTITITGTVGSNVADYFWLPPNDLSDPGSLTPRAYPQQDQVYTLVAQSDVGCTAQDSMRITMVAGLYIPTAFSPNNDGLNDKWRIPFIDALTNAHLSVYNRFGQIVYQSQNAKVEWDGTYKGKAQPQGTYKFNLTFSDGRKAISGTIVLVR